MREVFGGFGACGVFAFLFVSLPSFSCFVAAFMLFVPRLSCLSSCFVFSLVLVGLCGLLLWLLAFFPFRTISAKRKGAKCLPCVLFCPVVGCVGYSIAASGIRKLLQAVSILRFFPAIQAAVK